MGLILLGEKNIVGYSSEYEPITSHPQPVKFAVQKNLNTCISFSTEGNYTCSAIFDLACNSSQTGIGIWTY